ncbi:MAG: AEC family transporter [Thermoleophilia bacterium]|nr:AEC family transporter [Thermoleophilia bacterium]
MVATAFSALVMIALGVVLRKTGVVKRENAIVLVQITLYVLLPALVLKIMIGTNLNWDLMLVPLVAFAATAVMVPLGLALARMLKLGRAATGATIILIAVANTGFFGLPLIAASQHDYSLAVAVIYDALGTGILIWTFNPIVASWFGRGEIDDSLRLRSSLKGLLLPPMWCLVIGLILNLSGVHTLPDALQFPIDYLAAGLLPVVMLYAGLVLDWSAVADNWRVIAGVSVARLLIGPVVAFALGVAFGFTGAALDTITVLGGMPSGMMALVMGAHYRLPVGLLAGCVAVTTVLALFTLPIVTAVVH